MRKYIKTDNDIESRKYEVRHERGKGNPQVWRTTDSWVADLAESTLKLVGRSGRGISKVKM